MSTYEEGYRDGYRRRAAAATAAGHPSEVPLRCGCRLLLDYEQLTPRGPMPAAMEIHRGDCPTQV